MLSFIIKDFAIDAYAMNFVNNVPTRFQIFINHRLEGFMSYSDKWIVDKYSLGAGVLNEALAQEIGNYLMAYYS